MKTLNQMFKQIELASEHDDIKKRILTCGATHIAQDADGHVYAYRGEPEREVNVEEWFTGSGKDDRVMLYCAKLDAPENWKICVWQLP